MSYLRSLRIAIPLGVFLVFLGIVLTSLYSSLSQREETLWAEVIERGAGNAARIARHAERFLRTDPQVLEEDLTQLATDPALQTALLVEPDGKIRFANRFAWRNQPAAQVLPAEDSALLPMASRTREAVVRKWPDNHRAVFMMSYAVTDAGPGLRDLDRGVIVLAYDLSATRSQARREAIAERLLDLAALILAALGLVWVLHASVTRP
ncbi:MAG: hypothetical protein NHG36_10800, partial [Chromatiaceae bacterium]|nr:hypothetical protein [Candidatus Thioaporhodococcus sediminis]